MIECCRCTLNYSNRSNSNCLDAIMPHLIACQRGSGRLVFTIENTIIGTIRHLQKIVVPGKSGVGGAQVRPVVLNSFPTCDLVGRAIHLFLAPFFILAELKQREVRKRPQTKRSGKGNGFYWENWLGWNCQCNRRGHAKQSK